MLKRHCRNAAVFACVLLATLVGWHLADAAAAQKITVGIYNSKPLAFLDDAGRPQGFFIDVLNHIAQQENWEITYRPGSWNECLTRLANGEIDLLANVAQSAEREKIWDFTSDYLILDWASVFKQKGSAIHTIFDLQDKTVSVLKNAITTTEFKNLLDKFGVTCRLIEQEENAETLRSVHTGEADAAVCLNIYATLLEENFQIERTMIVFSPIKLRFAALKNTRPDLLSRLDRDISRLKADKASIYYHFLDKWIGADAQKTVLPQWLWWAALILLLFLMMLLIFNVMLKKRVNLQTADLRVANEHLEQEIAERKQAEKSLRANERLVKKVLETLPLGVWVADRMGVITQVNPAGQAIWRGARFVGIEQFEEYKAWWVSTGKRISPEEWGVARAISHRETSFEEEIEIECFDGSHKIILNWAAPIISDHGDIEGAISVNQDITERKQAEEKLCKSEARYRRLIDNSPDVVYIFSNQRGGIYYSPQAARLFGCPLTYLYDHPFLWNQSIHPDDIAAVVAAMQQFDAGHAFNVEYRVRDTRGDWHWILDRSIKRHHERNEILIEGLATDITDRKRAEEALRASREYLQAVLDSINDALFVDDADTGQIIDVNQRMCEMYGYTHDEALRTPIGELSQGEPPYSQTEALRWLQQARDIGFQTFEWRAKRKDGHLFWTEVSIRFVIMGQERRFVVIVRDISERKRTEETLKESERVKSEILDKLNDAQQIAMIGSWDWDLRTNQVWWSDETYRIFGVTPSEYTPSFEGNAQFIHPDDLAAYNEQFEHSLHTGAPLRYELRLLPKDGRLKYCYAKGKVTYDAAGTATHFVGTIMDITERKRTEQAFRESEERFRSFFENTPASLCILDRDLRYIAVNETLADMNRCSVREHLGRSIYEVLPRETADMLAPMLRQSLTTGEPTLDIEAEGAVHDGSRAAVWFRCFPVLWENDAPETIGCVGIDITIRKRAEEEVRRLNAELEQRVRDRTAKLEAANNELQSFAYVVSHDLKAPLRGIGQLAYWLVTDYADAFDAQGKEWIDLLIGRVKRLDTMIDGILTYSRIGRIEGMPTQIDMNQLVREICDLLAPPPHIRIFLQSDFPVVVGDKTRLTQVFENLIGNAIKFMDKPVGEIRIGCVDNGDYWTFSVTDNGPGIAAKYQEKVFQLFQTLTPRDERESTGIGLAIVKKIVEWYGGAVGVESTVGVGSAFWFTIPKSASRNSE